MIASCFVYSFFLSKANRKALAYADEMNREVEVKNDDLLRKSEKLEMSNKELNDFAYIASHDLKEMRRR